ncbi:hypothetical protein [Mesorhizobium sp. B1-1-5]|uniref:hypothetical protein n=1 Tax=Mesorhizobium sp. B1-1-5 TaxID=2589979 RepID=UPI001129BCCC|nr:hypothetical protein [Mesorhizobium sp. B1-1-5]TPN99872.1 hypothetical protein FJ980_24475 [Mesorhizobium sp. B1-1-5]
MRIEQIIDFDALRAGFAEWWKGHLEMVKDNFGEGETYVEAVRLLDEDPLQALQWYVEDMRRGLRAA